MATTITAPASHGRTLRRFLRIISLLLTLLVAGIILLVVWFRHTAVSSLAQMDGTIAVRGLQAPVQVVRDVHGVPHLKALSLHDLFFAQGYVTAQDRLWQMDLTRRAVAGEMAEVFPGGPAPAHRPSRVNGAATPAMSWVDYDKQQRILRLRSVADRVAGQLSPRDRAFFDAYSAGVNAYIARHKDNLPIEFHVLNYVPRPWTVSDSVLVGIGMSQLLNPQYETEYRREKIGEILSPELMADLYPTGSWRDHAPADDAGDAAKKTARTHHPLDSNGGKGAVACASAGCLTSQTALALRAERSLLMLPPADPNCEACLPGSNDWVVSGAHTVTGKPLLSNDMHLPHRVPGVWYEAHLESGNFNVEGFTLPGVPFVIVGHNQRIAWGFTNLNPDVQDLFVESFNAQGEYQTPTGWQKPERVHEVIHVKGKPDVNFDVVITRHGPIVSSLFPGETRQIAMQWLIYDTREIGIPLFDLDSAQNWEQFRKALSSFATPSQNV
ncbi:MAG: penicillin acylase family protein, partial [Actinomycetota bacterium]